MDGVCTNTSHRWSWSLHIPLHFCNYFQCCTGVLKCIPQGPFFDISGLTFCIKFYMSSIIFILDLIRFNLLNCFYEMWEWFVSEMIALMRFWISGFLEVVKTLYKHIRLYQLHQISFVCHHQELARTPKDPPRRVDMNERNLICFYNQNHWVIDKTV